MIETLHFQPAAMVSAPMRSVGEAMRRGLMGRCPKCGEGKLFRAYLKVADTCPACGEEQFHQRADDAPAYLTMLLVGHFIVAGIIAAEDIWPDGNMLVIGVIWSALTVAASLFMLPRIKGALVGYQWAMRMHGFGGHD
jgi:uncharacterized protein (DUF983 family)